MTQYLPTKIIAQKHGVKSVTILRWSEIPGFPESIPDDPKGKKWHEEEVAQWVNVHCERSGTYGNLRLIRFDQRDVGES
jgi:predicted DNA-binding transcriptional regulator AlpA